MQRHSLVMQFKQSILPNDPGCIVTLIFETNDPTLSPERIQQVFSKHFALCTEEGKAKGRTNAADILTRALEKADEELGTESWFIQAHGFCSITL